MASELTVQTLRGPTSGANANTILIPSGQVLDASAGFVAPAGSVIQVLSNTQNQQNAFSIVAGGISASFALTSTITPTSASSKLLVMVDLDAVTRTTDEYYGRFWLYRVVGGTTTTLRSFGYPWGWSSSDNSSGTTISMKILDTPSTTSPVQYIINFQAANGTVDFQINRDGQGLSTIVIQEIAG